MTSNNYFVKWRSSVSGPFAINELERMIRNNEISRIALVSGDGKTWTALAKTEIYKRITEESTAKAAPPKPDPVKIVPTAVPVPEPASTGEEEEDEAPVMARQFALRPPTSPYGPSFEELRRGYYPAQPMAGSSARQHDLYDNRDVSVRSRVTYQVLGFFFGLYGIHNFYAGRISNAIAQLLINFLVVVVCGVVGAYLNSAFDRVVLFGLGNLCVQLWIWFDLFTVDRDRENRMMPGRSIALVLLGITLVMFVLLVIMPVVWCSVALDLHI